MGSAPVFDQFPARGKTPSALASQSFPGFRGNAARTPASRSQITCATNCATPGYSVFCMIPCGEGKSKFFVSVGGAVVKPDFAGVFQPGNFRRKLLSQGLPGSHIQGNGWVVYPPKSCALPTALHPDGGIGHIQAGRKIQAKTLYGISLQNASVCGILIWICAQECEIRRRLRSGRR